MNKHRFLILMSLLMVLTAISLGVGWSSAETLETMDSQEALETQEDIEIEGIAETPEVMEAQEAEESQEAVETVEIIGTQETTELSQNENPAPKSQDVINVTIVAASSQNNSRISLYERYFNRIENKNRALEMRRRNIEAGR